MSTQKTKKQPRNPRPTTCRSFEAIIYVESESYNYLEVLDNLCNYFPKYSYILHDKDVYEDGENKGQLKKAHFHFYGQKVNATTISAVSKFSGVPEVHINFVRKWNIALRYQMHLDNPEKYQYNRKDITTNIVDIDQFFNVKGEGEKVIELMELKLQGYSYKEVLYYAVKNGLYSEFRRNLGVIDLIWKEEKEKALNDVYGKVNYDMGKGMI